MRRGFRRKFMTIKFRMSTLECSLRIIMHLTSNAKKKRKRFKKPYSCQKEKKLSKLRSYEVKMIKRNAIRFSKLSKRIR